MPSSGREKDKSKTGKRDKPTALSQLMDKQGLNASQLEKELEKSGVQVTADYLRKLASGERGMNKTSVELRKGLKAIFGLNEQEWKDLFNLYVPSLGESQGRESFINALPVSRMVRVDAFVATGGKPIEYQIPEANYRTGMCVFFVEGDSMDTGKLDSIRDGDILYVDRKDTTPKNGKIYVFEVIGDGYCVKRIRKSGEGMWLLISDNPAYEPIEVDLENHDFESIGFKVVGRVFKVWGSRDAV
jgi:phage repressor protein C with HTH and peptisase S24 domain